MAAYSGGNMGHTDISMDYDMVQLMADGFLSTADQLHAVDRALGVAIDLLNATAFVGMVGNQLLADYLENTQPHIRRLATTCSELHDDLVGAIASLRDGDHSESLRFVSDGGARAAGTTASGSRSSSIPTQGEDGQLYDSNGELYGGKPSEVDVVFINGIDTDFNGFKEGLGNIQSHWDTNAAQIAGIFNAPFSDNSLVNKVVDSVQGVGDRVQALLGIRLSNNEAVENLKDLIRANAYGDRELELVGYSQGGAIVSAALNDLYRENPSLVSFVKVTTFGSFGFEYPPGPDYHFYVHQQDLIPLAGQTLGLATLGKGVSIGEVARYYSNLTVLDAGTENILEAHSLEKYLAHHD